MSLMSEQEAAVAYQNAPEQPPYPHVKDQIEVETKELSAICDQLEGQLSDILSPEEAPLEIKDVQETPMDGTIQSLQVVRRRLVNLSRRIRF